MPPHHQELPQALQVSTRIHVPFQPRIPSVGIGKRLQIEYLLSCNLESQLGVDWFESALLLGATTCVDWCLIILRFEQVKL
jgi:hypothetical protein